MKKHKILDKKRLMKNMTSVISILVAALLVFSSAVLAVNYEENQEELKPIVVDSTIPTLITTDIESATFSDPNGDDSSQAEYRSSQDDDAQPLDIWDLQFHYDTGGDSGSLYLLGVAFDGEYFWQSSFNSNAFYYWDIDGNYQGTFNLGGTSGIIDMCYDGEYAYGCAFSGYTLYQIDLPGQTVVDTISLPSASYNVAYDSDDDAFWIGQWNYHLTKIDRDGNVLDTISPPESMLGLAYDNTFEYDGYDGPFLWISTGTSGPPCVIKCIDIASKTLVAGLEWNVADDLDNGQSGALWMDYLWDSSKSVLMGGVQGVGDDYMYGYEISLLIPPEHDVALKKILKPESGYATENMEIQVLLQNKGNHSETTDVQFQIIKCESDIDLLDENFSGTFPPANWTTDYWQQSNTANAGGEAPEARCYKYTQSGYPYYDYYDNNITSAPVNATGWEKVNLKFKLTADVYYDNYCYLYLKYRKNSTSNWVDKTPWTNPIPEDFGPQDFEIGCYGWGDDIGNEWQFKLEYLGYYYYFNYWYLDDVVVEACAGCAEYAEIVEDVVVPWDEEVVVDFPTWTPTEWQNESAENSFEEYPIEAFILLDDDNSKNDYKNNLITIYYPWMHDVGSINITGLQSGPGQAFQVGGNINNFGQYEECCFKTHMQVGSMTGKFIDETFDDGIWDTDYSNWRSSNTEYAGGDKPEAMFYYYPTTYYVYNRMYSEPIDTTGFTEVPFSFKTYVNHYGSYYYLYVQTSTDGVNWNTCPEWGGYWNKNYGPAIEEFTMDTTHGIGSDTFQVAFTFYGYSWYINWWCVDDVTLKDIQVIPEFEKEVCIESIIPGEVRTLDFGDWTPEFLAEDTTEYGKDYAAYMYTDMFDPEDKNEFNDDVIIEFELDFWHDVGIEEFNEPNSPVGRDILWDNGGIDSSSIAIASQLAANYPFHAQVADDFILDTDAKLETFTFWGDFWNGAPVNPEDFNIILYDDDGGKPTGSGSDDPTPTALAVWEMELEGVYDSYGYKYVATLDPPYPAEADVHYWIVAQIDMSFPPQWGWQHNGANPDQLDPGVQGFPLLGMNYWQVHGYGDMAFMLEGTPGGAPAIDVYIQPGSESLECTVKNYGTFMEEDMVCYAELWEYYTDMENGTFIEERNRTDIDLEPLGGTKLIDFDTFNFNHEGIYGFIANLPGCEHGEEDDVPGNNDDTLGIGVDDTDPVSEHEMEFGPDGDNGWYVSDVIVTLDAIDPEVLLVSSGVKEIKYKIGTGSWQTIPQTDPGSSELSGTFIMDVDGDDISIEYYAVDYVGNEESHNSFTIDMDQTVPDIEEVQWEAFQDPPGYGDWYVTFTCDAVDETSTMDRVEMFINDGFHEEVVGPGPTYEFTIQWSPAFKSVIFWFYHYDVAGNVIADDLAGDEPVSYAYYQQQSNPVSKLTHQ